MQRLTEFGPPPNEPHKAVLDEGVGQPFFITQNPADGSITISNLPFSIGGQEATLYRPLNSRTPWPLYCTFNDEEYNVFNGDGELTVEFIRLIRYG